jgi:chemotaxis protein CheD
LLPARFGVHAMEMLINGMLKLGAERSRLVAKVFGGANVISSLGGEGSIAEQNADFIERFLADEDIKLVAKKLRGGAGLRVHFETGTGKAFVWTIDRAEAVLVEQAHRESGGHRLPTQTDLTRDITFF